MPRWLTSRAVQPEGRRLNDGWTISVIVDELPCCYCISTLTPSILWASPSVQSIAFPEGPDISFGASFLRPMASAYSSQEQSRLSPIDESPSSESPAITYSSSSSPSLTPTAIVSGASPLADGRQNDIGPPQSSDGLSSSLQSPPVITPHYFEPPHASGSQRPMRRENFQSPDTYLDSFSFDRSETQRNAPSPQTGIAMADSLGRRVHCSSPQHYHIYHWRVPTRQ